MEVNLQAIAAMRAITVSREYGSGAEKLQHVWHESWAGN